MFRFYKCFLLCYAPFLCFGQTAQPPVKIGSVTFQGSFRTRLEMWNWFEGNGDNSYAFSGNLLRFGFSQQLTRLDWQVEFAAPFLLALPEDAIATGAQGQLGLGANYFAANDRKQNVGMVFPKQAFVRFKNLFGDRSQSLRLGRFEFLDGSEAVPASASLAWVKRERISQRLIGNFGWTHVGRSLDGAHYIWNRGKTNVTVVAGVPTRGVFQTDGWGNLPVATLYAALTRQMPGSKHNSEFRVFGIHYDDTRDVVKTDNRPVALRNIDRGSNVRISSFGGHFLHASATRAGEFDVMAWGLGQTGKWATLDHRAAALAFEAGWQPSALKPVKPWFRAGWSRTTGDDNPLDNTHGTFFQLMPTPRPYARFPFFNMMNNEDFSGTLLLRPHKALTLRTEAHALRLTSGNDLWYVGGGAFQPWSFGYVGRATSGNRGLATLYDVSADYAVNARLSITGYFGHAVGHSAIRAIYPSGSNSNFGYIELTTRF